MEPISNLHPTLILSLITMVNPTVHLATTLMIMTSTNELHGKVKINKNLHSRLLVIVYTKTPLFLSNYLRIPKQCSLPLLYRNIEITMRLGVHSKSLIRASS